MLELDRRRGVAEIARWALDVPLQIAFIVVGARWSPGWRGGRSAKGCAACTRGRWKSGSGRCAAACPARCKATEETSLRAEQRIEALTGVLRSLTTFVIWLIAAFMILGEVGISLAPLLAGAGVIGVALGFGSQSLVKDFLSGIFILVEDQFGVGDIIDIESQVSGVVEGVSLRTTRLRSVDGVVWHVPNGEIRMVGNMSQHWSRSLLDVEVAYETDIEQAKAVIKRVADRSGRRTPRCSRSRRCGGSNSSGRAASSSVWSSKRPRKSSGGSSRQLREQIKRAFDEEGIEIPFPQQAVWYRGQS